MHARAHTHTHTHTLPRWSNGKESTCVQARTHAINPPASSGDAGLIPGSGRSPGEGNGNPLQYSCLENAMDVGAWCPWGRKESDTTERLQALIYETGRIE